MSETESTLFNKRVSRLWIAGALLLQAIVIVVRVPSPSPPILEPVRVETQTEPRRVQRTPPRVLDAEAYYQTIIDNNLFRPLGWTPPRPIEPYRLIGTVLARDENTPAEAIIQTTTGNKTYIVTTGEQIDASTRLVSIESKSVRLSTNGKQRTLRLPSGF